MEFLPRSLAIADVLTLLPIPIPSSLGEEGVTKTYL